MADAPPNPAPDSPSVVSPSVRHLKKKESGSGHARTRTITTGRSNASSVSEAPPSPIVTKPRLAAPKPSSDGVKTRSNHSPSTSSPVISDFDDGSGPASAFVDGPKAREDPSNKIAFQHSLNLRKYRVKLLTIRKKLQDQVFRKYRTVRDLMAAFDKDGDGVINESDWIYGLTEFNFPLTRDEGKLMFRAIDENGDNMLTYKEMVDILEPASLTSWEKPGEAEKMSDMVGFTKFSKKQAKAFAQGRPMTPGGTRLAEEPYDVHLPASPRPVNAEAGRPPESINEEIQMLKDKLEKAIAKSGGDETMLFRVAKLFKLFDVDKKHYLTAHEFLNALGDGQLGLPLNDRERAIIAHECADDNGAVDLTRVSGFFSKAYVPIQDALLESQKRGLAALRRQAQLDLELSATAPLRAPPEPFDPYLTAHSKFLASPLATGSLPSPSRSSPSRGGDSLTDTAVENPFRPSTSGSPLRSSGSGMFRPNTTASGARLPSVRSSGGDFNFTATASGVHPLLTMVMDKAAVAGPRVVHPDRGLSPKDAAYSPSKSMTSFMNSTGGSSGRFMTTKMLSTTGSGLSIAAEDVLNETYSLHVKPREKGLKDLAGKDDVKQTIRAPAGTAAFASPSERFVSKHDPSFTQTDAFHTTTRALEMSRADRKAAAEERVMATYAKEAFQASEMERIRIAEKRRQKLEYLEATGNMF